MASLMSLDTVLERHDLSQPFLGLQMRHKVGDKVFNMLLPAERIKKWYGKGAQ